MKTMILFSVAVVMLAIGCANEPACTENSPNLPSVMAIQAEGEQAAAEVYGGNMEPANALATFSDMVTRLEQLTDPANYSRLLATSSQVITCYKNFSQEMVNGQRSDHDSIYSACTVYIQQYKQANSEYQLNCK